MVPEIHGGCYYITMRKDRGAGRGHPCDLESWASASTLRNGRSSRATSRDFTCLLGARPCALHKVKTTSHTQGQDQDSRRQTA